MSDFEKRLASAAAALERMDDPNRVSIALWRVIGALEALSAERAAERKRAAALDALARNDADQIMVESVSTMKPPPWPLKARSIDEAFRMMADHVATATARVAKAREAAPEPVSVGHWGMH